MRTDTEHKKLFEDILKAKKDCFNEADYFFENKLETLIESFYESNVNRTEKFIHVGVIFCVLFIVSVIVKTNYGNNVFYNKVLTDCSIGKKESCLQGWGYFTSSWDREAFSKVYFSKTSEVLIRENKDADN